MPFIKTGNHYRKAPKGVKISKRLLPGLHRFECNQKDGVHLVRETARQYKLPATIYGEHHKRVDRIMRAWDDRKEKTGILLNGLKGSGKTLVVKDICNIGMKRRIPIVKFDRILNDGWSLDYQLDRISDNRGKAIITIDEMEKTFHRKEWQEKLLTLLDGASQGNNLFLITTNNTETVNQYFFNRPNRILYHWEYGSVERSLMKTIVRERLKNESRLEETISFLSRVQELSFDIIMNIIDEMNRFDVSVKEASSVLSIHLRTRTGFNL